MKKYLCIFAALTLGGCVSMKTVPVSLDALRAHQGQNLTVIAYKKSDFAAMTQSLALSAGLFGAIGGLAGASIAVQNGNALIAENGIPDPALDISAKLSPQFQDTLKPSDTKVLADLDTKAIDEATISKLAGNSGVVFDIQTVNWQFIYFPFSVHYRVIAAMRARLIDANTAIRIAQEPCVYESDDKDPPTYDEMLAEHAARLKAMLAIATNSCSDTLQKAFFGH